MGLENMELEAADGAQEEKREDLEGMPDDFLVGHDNIMRGGEGSFDIFVGHHIASDKYFFRIPSETDRHGAPKVGFEIIGGKEEAEMVFEYACLISKRYTNTGRVRVLAEQFNKTLFDDLEAGRGIHREETSD